jgi:hypothetical protein
MNPCWFENVSIMPILVSSLLMEKLRWFPINDFWIETKLYFDPILNEILNVSNKKLKQYSAAAAFSIETLNFCNNLIGDCFSVIKKIDKINLSTLMFRLCF